MKKTICLVLSLLILIFSLCACDRGGDSSSPADSSGTDNSAPPVIVTPSYNVQVDVTVQDFGGSTLPEGEVIEKASKTVYGLRATSLSVETLGSAVALMTGSISEAEEKAKVPENSAYCTFFATCLSLIREADEFVLTDSEGVEYTAELIGADPNTDVAVLAVNDRLPTATLVADSDAIPLLTELYAVGYPFNAGTGVVKKSALGAREHSVAAGAGFRRLMILSDELSLGYTGGGTFASQGGVLAGLVTSVEGVETDGYSFVIPSNVLRSIAEGLISTYSATNYGYIEGSFVLGGIFEDARMTTSPYVYIAELDRTGSLYLGGMRVGDRITRISYIKNGESEETAFAEVVSVADIREFFASIPSLKVGDSLSFRYVRDKLVSTRRVEVLQYVYGSRIIND